MEAWKTSVKRIKNKREKDYLQALANMDFERGFFFLNMKQA